MSVNNNGVDMVPSLCGEDSMEQSNIFMGMDDDLLHLPGDVASGGRRLDGIGQGWVLDILPR
ncbi:hypothetical protein BBP40_010984 [Aspergillus hancockii]|nr:hypothetical protein BBP40_010984 [Aspergillus hancockii]